MSNCLEHKTPLSCPHLLPSALALSVGGELCARHSCHACSTQSQGTHCRRAGMAAVAVALGAAHTREKAYSEPKAEARGKQVGVIKFIA